MKKLRFLTSILLAITLVFQFSFFAFAESITENDATEHADCAAISPGDHAEPMYNGTCGLCGSYTTIVCMQEDMHCGQSSHSTLLYGECVVHYYESTSIWYCEACERVMATYAPHICWQMHISCSLKPIYNVCTCPSKREQIPSLW